MTHAQYSAYGYKLALYYSAVQPAVACRMSEDSPRSRLVFCWSQTAIILALSLFIMSPTIRAVVTSVIIDRFSRWTRNFSFITCKYLFAYNLDWNRDHSYTLRLSYNIVFFSINSQSRDLELYREQSAQQTMSDYPTEIRISSHDARSIAVKRNNSNIFDVRRSHKELIEIPTLSWNVILYILGIHWQL